MTKLVLNIQEIPSHQLIGGIKPGQKLEFGKIFTDRMFIMRYVNGQWQDAQIKKFSNLELSPAAIVLHYAQEVFEGLKAYYRVDGKIGLFRPRDNFIRMNNSAERMCLPNFDGEFVLQALRELLKLEQGWLPRQEGTSLYIRPTLIGIDPKIGLKPAEECLFYIIMSPVGAYYANGFQPTKIIVEDKYVRAVRGGIGAAKTGANYAASMLSSKEALKKGFDQVLWLDGVQRRFIEEVGSMNIFFMYGEKLVTPALNGSILPGITRDSVIKIAKSWGLEVAEETLDIEQIISDLHSGRITEVFGSGTAAVISPVGLMRYREKDVLIGDNKVGKFTQKFYDTLTGIQYGKIEDTFGWTETI